MYEERSIRKHAVIFQTTMDKGSLLKASERYQNNIRKREKSNNTLNFSICSNASTRQTQTFCGPGRASGCVIIDTHRGS